MDLQAAAQLLGNFGEFVGAIAVVGTLIKHSKDALDANTRALDEHRKLTRTQGVREIVDRWEQILYRATGATYRGCSTSLSGT
jgi:hypothetical protein